MYSLGKVSQECLIIYLGLCSLENLAIYSKLEASSFSSIHNSCSVILEGAFPGLSSEELEAEFQLGEATERSTL